MELNFWTVYFIVFCGCLIYLSVFSDEKTGLDILGRIIDSLIIPLVMMASYGLFIDLLELLS